MIRCGVRGKRLLGAWSLATVVALVVGMPASAATTVPRRRQRRAGPGPGAKPGQTVKLKRKGKLVDTDSAGSLGASIFRRVKPGKGYTVTQGRLEGRPGQGDDRRNDPPSTKTYDQNIPVSGKAATAT